MLEGTTLSLYHFLFCLTMSREVVCREARRSLFAPLTWLETKVERRSPSTIYELRLRPHVRWTEDTVDNEHMNRKRSKSSSLSMLLFLECCIYHKPHEFGESSSDCSSDESDWVDSSDLEK